METANIVKDYLEKKNITAACRTENVFVYQAQMTGESRVCACEVLLREMGEDLVLTAALPVSVRVREARGVARWLANLNDAREKPGFFELDNLAGRIQFRVRMHGPLTDEQLEVGIQYCLEQVETESDRIVKLVCEESHAVREREIAAIRKKQSDEAEAGQTPTMRAVNRILEFIGLRTAPDVDPSELDRDEDERLTFKVVESQPEPQPAIPADADADDVEIIVEPVCEQAAEPDDEEVGAEQKPEEE